MTWPEIRGASKPPTGGWNAAAKASLRRLCHSVRVSLIDQDSCDFRIHYGGSLSCVELITTLYARVKKKEDLFILSKGHACLTLYIVLSKMGVIGLDELKRFKQIDGILQGHPDMNTTPGIDMSTGSLGHGLSVGVGMALEKRFRKTSNFVYCLIGDGECQSGQIWEAAMAAAHYSLDNLIVILDNNNMQVDGYTEDIMRLSPLKNKWESFGWYVETIDGHDVEQISKAIRKAKRISLRPKIIIANTVKGRGVGIMENTPGFHSAKLSEREAMAVKNELKVVAEDLE